MPRRRTAALRGVLLLAPVACSVQGGQGPPADNSTRVLLTDAPFPFDRVERVDLHFVSVSGSIGADTSAGSPFVTLATPGRRVNLLELQNGITEELGALELPEGAITAVRLVIDTDRSTITLNDGRVLTGASTPGIDWQSSAGRPVLNALIHEQILVPDTGGTVVIDFDVGKAFISAGEGFIFSPVFRAVDGTRTGSIAGVVEAAGNRVEAASLRLYVGDPDEPENTWSVIATARTDAAGAFRFSFVTRSAYWTELPAQSSSRYLVAVDPPAGVGAGRVVVPDVSVTAGRETSLGIVALPGS